MRLLDLFSGAGLAADGYSRFFTEIVGVDIHFQHRYPYDFVQEDALKFPLQGFDAVHASPPCQAYSDLEYRNNFNSRGYPDLISAIRMRLRKAQVPWVIENVFGSPLRKPVILCGTMFPTLRVIRHRHFESNFRIPEPEHPVHPPCYTLDKRSRFYGVLDEWEDFVMVNGGGNCSQAAAQDAMGVHRYVTKAELNEGVPPLYTEHIGYYLAREVRRRK